jgi:hypothetical protein
LRNLPYPANGESLADSTRILEAVPTEFQPEARGRLEQYASENWNQPKLAERIQKAVDWRRQHGDRVKLWCAEFGCYQAAPPEDRCQYIRDVRELFDRNDIAWCYWSYNEAFSVLSADRTPYGDAKSQTPDSALLRSLMPEKYGETPVTN